MRLTKNQIKCYFDHIISVLDVVEDKIEYELGINLIPIDVEVDALLIQTASLEGFLSCHDLPKIKVSKDAGIEEQDITSNVK